MILEDFKNIHIGRKAFIIGKGPSLDKIGELAPEMLLSGPMFCCNEAIHKVEECVSYFVAMAELSEVKYLAPMYVVQQDSELEFDCVPKMATTVHFMNSMQHDPSQEQLKYRYKSTRITIGVSKKRVSVSQWNPAAVLYDAPVTDFTAVAALTIAYHMGIRHVVFVCFDSWAGEPGQYAKCVGKNSGALGDIGRHAANGAWIRECACKLMEKVETRLPDIGIIK